MRRPSTTQLRRRRTMRGLTLLEVMLAAAGTAIVGAAAASMISAVSHGESSTRDMRELVARHKALSARVTASLRESRQVLAEGSDFVVLWVADLDDDDQPDLLELRRLDYDAAADTLSSYVAPTGTTDVQYSTSENFETTTDALMGGATFPEAVWARDVSAVAWSFNDADATLATLVTMRSTLTSGDESDQAVVTAALRNAQ